MLGLGIVHHAVFCCSQLLTSTYHHTIYHTGEKNKEKRKTCAAINFEFQSPLKTVQSLPWLGLEEWCKIEG